MNEKILEPTGDHLEDAEKAFEAVVVSVQGEPCTRGDLAELEKMLKAIKGDEAIPLEPLWVRNQQNKSFKRGKK